MITPAPAGLTLLTSGSFTLGSTHSATRRGTKICSGRSCCQTCIQAGKKPLLSSRWYEFRLKKGMIVVRMIPIQ
jgi:hypothetical protein